MLKDDVRVVEGAMRGNDLLFNYEIAAWNRIKKFIEESGEQRLTKQSTPCSMCGEPVLLADIHCGRCKSKNISYWFADKQYECLHCNFIWKK